MFYTWGIEISQHFYGPFGLLVLTFCGLSPNFKGNWSKGTPTCISTPNTRNIWHCLTKYGKLYAVLHLMTGCNQGRSQPHSPGWAKVPLSSFFLKFWSIFLIFPQTLLIFFLILVLRVGESPTREGPGYATGCNFKYTCSPAFGITAHFYLLTSHNWYWTKTPLHQGMRNLLQHRLRVNIVP